MKNKIVFSLAALLFWSLTTIGQNTTPAPAKWGIGAAVIDGPFLGGQITADYFLKSKLSFGAGVILGAPNFNGPNRRGYNLEAMLTAKYYLLGHNASGRAGLYVQGSLGYIGGKSTYGSIGNSNYVQWTVNGLGAALSIGGDLKLGPGRLFLEAQNTLMILGDSEIHGTYQTAPPESFGYRALHPGFWGIHLKLGYVIHF
jgi:hypothetical protein